MKPIDFNHMKAKLFHSLKNHAQTDPIPFHVPGHKKGKGMDLEFSNFMGFHALSIDTTNISALDDLHHPKSFIQEAQQFASDAFGSDLTFFSVQGTSSAIMTMILSVCKRGEKIIVPRNAHKSVLSSIIIAGIHPIFITPEIDTEWGIAHGIHVHDVERAILENPDAKAIFLINPTYYGVTSNINKIVEIAHLHSIPVLVDEAHGTFLHFHHALPASAMEAGADMTAISVHKLGGALSQGSLLCLKSELIDYNQVHAMYTMLTTTSPSYIILASLDTARRYLALHGEQELSRVLEIVESARSEINTIPGLMCFGEEHLKSEASYDYDRIRLVVNVKKLGITGLQAEKWLHQHHRIDVELSDLTNLLCIVSTGDSEESLSSLVEALHNLSAEFYSEHADQELAVETPPSPELVILPQDAYHGEKISLPLEESVGYIMAESYIFYPPGIPVLLPGERITPSTVSYITKYLSAGSKAQGTKDPTGRSVQVAANFIPASLEEFVSSLPSA